MPLSRRSVLGLGLVGGAAVAAGGALASLSRTRLRTPAGPLRYLSVAEFSVVAAVAELLVPGGGTFPGAAAAHAAERVDATLAVAPPGLAAELRDLIRTFESPGANLLFGLGATSFTEMSPERQRAALADWEHSRLRLRRTGYQALRGLVVGAYYSNPAVYPAVGYPGPPEFEGLPPTVAAAPKARLEEP